MGIDFSAIISNELQTYKLTANLGEIGGGVFAGVFLFLIIIGGFLVYKYLANKAKNDEEIEDRILGFIKGISKSSKNE